MSPDELAARMRAAGKSISKDTIWRACRGGQLGAVRVGRSWLISQDAADAFAEGWEPYASLKAKK